MNRLLATSMIFLVAHTGACTSDAQTGVDYPATLRTGADLTDAVACDADSPCPAGQTCAYVDLATDPLGNAICVDPATICDDLDCGDGACFIAESYPAQISCHSDDDGSVPDGDDDDSVSSDGDGSGGSAPGAEPGNPGDDDGDAEPGNPGELLCDAFTTCPEGLQCIAVPGGTVATCSDVQTACAALGCDDGCLVQETYPLQLACQ